MFANRIKDEGNLPQVSRIKVELYGSLGATGRGHGSDKAVIGGLIGDAPETVDPGRLVDRLNEIQNAKKIRLLGEHEIEFDFSADLIFSGVTLEFHANGLKFTAFDRSGAELLVKTYYSVGGGFVVDQDATGQAKIVLDSTPVAFPFSTGIELLEQCHQNGLCISTLMLENEKAWNDEKEVRRKLLEIWQVMRDCVYRGCRQEGILPGGLKVRRRAAPLYRRLKAETAEVHGNLESMDWVNLWALAVNEENAAGGRVVTAPTNGAAGIIPAVLHYYHKYCPGANDDATVRFLLTAAAIGTLFKTNASISGAEVGCQGEVGSACSMAAAGLTEVLGGTPAQVENAAEIGMEHNLGLTCDPIGGLVQVPCIERNAMASVKAINAARLALRGDGTHFVSLDKVIKTMRETGRDMKTKYKETARGGLAVNVIEC